MSRVPSGWGCLAAAWPPPGRCLERARAVPVLLRALVATFMA